MTAGPWPLLHLRFFEHKCPSRQKVFQPEKKNNGISKGQGKIFLQGKKIGIVRIVLHFVDDAPQYVTAWQKFARYNGNNACNLLKKLVGFREKNKPDNQRKCQDNGLPIGKLMKLPFEDRNHRINGNNYKNKLRSVRNQIDLPYHVGYHMPFVICDGFLGRPDFKVSKRDPPQGNLDMNLFKIKLRRYRRKQNQLWNQVAQHSFVSKWAWIKSYLPG